MIEKEQKAKRVYHRTKPASKSKVRAIRFDLDLVEFINLQPNVSLFINDLIRREKEKIERMKAIEVREILKEMEYYREKLDYPSAVKTYRSRSVFLFPFLHLTT